MKNQFNPIKGKPGEFRIALNLSELGDRAWEMLARSQALGFEQPQFKTRIRHSGVAEVWAVILEQVHSYDADTRIVVDEWDAPIDSLRQAIGEGNEFNLIMLCNFREYLEADVA